MVTQIRIFFVTFIVFLLIDMVWLGFIAKDLYKKYIGYIMSPKPNWIAAIIFYVIFIIGLMYFVLNPALKNESALQALFAGMLFGLITYATYDLTNLATLKDWPLKITVIDLIWGTSLSGLTSIASYFVNRLF